MLFPGRQLQPHDAREKKRREKTARRRHRLPEKHDPREKRPRGADARPHHIRRPDGQRLRRLRQKKKLASIPATAAAVYGSTVNP